VRNAAVVAVQPPGKLPQPEIVALYDPIERVGAGKLPPLELKLAFGETVFPATDTMLALPVASPQL
jgi:hypothetical protein